jgi:Double-GTPase 2
MTSHEESPESLAGPIDPVTRIKPAPTPLGLGEDAKYCPRCPGWYRLDDVVAESKDGSSRTSAATVVLRVTSPGNSRRSFMSSWRKPTSLTKAERANIAAMSFRLKCPNNHELINSLDPTVVVGVIGNTGSSKSHYLAGLVYEIIHEERLKALGADVAYIGDTGKEMEERIKDVYARGTVLPRTEGGNLSGPFSYRLTRNLGATTEIKEVLTFFDVAGEDCTGELARSAEFVRYIFDATGIILLIDPGGLPLTENRLLAREEKIELTTRAIIDNLANALEVVTGRPSREQRHIICITIAKADSVTIPQGVWPPDVWTSVATRRMSNSKTRGLLRDYSERCRAGLADIGGEAVINAAEARFRRSRIFYSAVSATSQAPEDDKWPAPHPMGCSIPLAQTLWFADEE